MCPFLRLSLIHISLDAGEYQQAQQLFADAVQSGEEAVLAYRGLGLSYMGLAQYEDAQPVSYTHLVRSGRIYGAARCLHRRCDKDLSGLQL